MSAHTMKFQVEMVEVDKDLAKAVGDARMALHAAEKAVIDAYQKSPRYAAMLDMSGYGSGGGYGKSRPSLAIMGSRIVCNVMIDLDDAPRQQIYIDPKTANLLLSGKLLSDDENRLLLKGMGIQIPDAEDAS